MQRSSPCSGPTIADHDRDRDELNSHYFQQSNLAISNGFQYLFDILLRSLLQERPLVGTNFNKS